MPAANSKCIKMSHHVASTNLRADKPDKHKCALHALSCVTRPSLFTPVLQDHEVRIVPLNPPHLAVLHGHCSGIEGQNMSKRCSILRVKLWSNLLTHCLCIRASSCLQSCYKRPAQAGHKPLHTPLCIKLYSNCLDLLHSSTFPCGASRFCHSFQRCSSFSQRRTSVK